VVLVVLAVAPDLTTLMVASVVHGLAWGLRGPVMTAMRTDYFGISSFGTIMGWSTGLVSMGLVLGPLLVSGLEAGPGYRVAFLVVAAITGVGSLAFVALRRPRPHAVAAGPASGRGGAVTPG
jgi:MFS family permease